MANQITERNTRFALPIVCPVGKDEVSAETLYNRACVALDQTIDSHIGDLILDNLNYSAKPYDDAALCEQVYAWAGRVRAEISAN
jgi:hypothetical protein